MLYIFKLADGITFHYLEPLVLTSTYTTTYPGKANEKTSKKIAWGLQPAAAHFSPNPGRFTFVVAF